MSSDRISNQSSRTKTSDEQDDGASRLLKSRAFILVELAVFTILAGMMFISCFRLN